MSRKTTLVARTALTLIPLWLAFMLPSWLDSSFYDQCQSFNCFTSPGSSLISLVLGLGLGVGLNVFFTVWTRNRHSSVVDES